MTAKTKPRGLGTAALVAFALISSSGCHKRPPSLATVDAGLDAKPPHVDAADAGLSKTVPEAAAAPADDALPPFTSDELTTRAKHLLEAIAKDDPDLATDLVFPRDAFLSVKDVPDPGKVWDTKVLAAFRKVVHALHKRTKGVERATFTSFEVGQPASEAMPKRHDLKRMLWRSKRSRLGFVIDGKPGHFDVVEMTGWRGAWYVTRLR
jgi:hypothetical protein